MTHERVVITGVGPVAEIGIGKEDFCNRIGAISTERRDDPSAAIPETAAKLSGALRKYIGTEKTYLDRTSELALAASNLAIEDAGVDLAGEECRRMGVILGTWLGPTKTLRAFNRGLVAKGRQLADPLLFTHSMMNIPASLVAIEHKFRGENVTLASGCLSGLDAIGYAHDLLTHGRASALLAGGVDSGDAGCMQEGSRRRRGEGAAIVLLETSSHALSRNARVYAELCELTIRYLEDASDAAPRMAEALEAALASASTHKDQVQVVFAADNEDGRIGRAERAALERTFGTCSGKVRIRPPHHLGGDALGSSGALAVVVGALQVWKHGGAGIVNLSDGETFCCVVVKCCQTRTLDSRPRVEVKGSRAESRNAEGELGENPIQ